MSDAEDLPEVTIDEITGHLDIEYPCRWLYKLIGRDEPAIREAVLEVIDIADVTIELSNTSNAGNFVSINVEVAVQDQEQRRALFEALRAHDAVSMVL